MLTLSLDKLKFAVAPLLDNSIETGRLSSQEKFITKLGFIGDIFTFANRIIEPKEGVFKPYFRYIDCTSFVDRHGKPIIWKALFLISFWDHSLADQEV